MRFIIRNLKRIIFSFILLSTITFLHERGHLDTIGRFSKVALTKGTVIAKEMVQHFSGLINSASAVTPETKQQ